jgi:GGDEF domain-containing protein
VDPWDRSRSHLADVCQVPSPTSRADNHALSQMMNRGQFLGLADGAIRRSGRTGATLAVVIIGFDGLASGAGARRATERVLGAAVARVTRGIRWTDPTTRLNSGQVAVLCENLHGPTEADLIAARLRRAFRHPVEVDGTSVSIVPLTGVALASGPADDAATVVAWAGAALRAARQAAHRSPAAPAPPGAAQALPGRRDRRPPAGGPASVDAASGIDMRIELTSSVIRRISGVALTLASAASLVDGPAATRVHGAVDELDALIRDIRAGVFELLIPPPATGDR